MEVRHTSATIKTIHTTMKKMFFLLGACVLSLLLNNTDASAGVVKVVTSCGKVVFTISELHENAEDLLDTVQIIEEVECGDKTKR